MPYATYRFNKIIAAETIRFIVTVAIVVYKGLKLVVYRMLTNKQQPPKSQVEIRPGIHESSQLQHYSRQYSEADCTSQYLTQNLVGIYLTPVKYHTSLHGRYEVAEHHRQYDLQVRCLQYLVPWRIFVSIR